MTQIITMVWSLTQSQTSWKVKSSGPKKASLRTKLVGWWNSSWAIANPKRWCCESAPLSIPANLENSAVATGLEKVSFHSSPKERQCQRMLKLPHNCTHLTCYSSNAQNSPSQASILCELWTSRCSTWFCKRKKNQRLNYQHPLDHQKSKRVPEKHLFLLYWLCQSLWVCGPQ